MNYKNLKTRFIYDDYANEAIYDISYFELFKTYIADLRYDSQVTDKLTITPRITYNYHKPWYIADDPIRNRIGIKMNNGLSLVYNIHPKINLVAGFDYSRDQGKYENIDTTILFFNNKEELKYQNLAIYAQTLLKTRFLDITAGGRYENHSHYGSAFAPRMGVNKTINKFHFKLLYSRAFHSPTIGNLIYNQDIKPETADVTELELGYKISENIFATVNLFDIKLKEAILFFDEGDDWGYKNAGKMNSQGFEIDLRSKYYFGYFNLAYSFYKSEMNDDISFGLFGVEGHEEQTIAAPQHKITFNSSINYYKEFSINPSVIYQNRCFGYTEVLIDEESEEESVVINEIQSSLLLNVFFNFRNVFKGLDLGLGVYDILNERYPFVQGYNGWHPPFPGMSREFVFNLKYNFKFR